MVALRVLTNMEQPSIDFLHLRIDEPITTATDLVLAAICFYAFIRIRELEYAGRVKWYFKYYFLTLGLGTLFGGLLGHAFKYRLSDEWKLFSWVLVLSSVALMAHALVEMAKPLVRPRICRVISRFNLIVFAVALFFTIWSLAFSPVTYYSIYGMLVVVGSFSFYIYRKTGRRGMRLLLSAVLVGLVSVLIFRFQWGLSPWFNHRDVSHVILGISIYSFYRAAVLIMDGSVISP